MKIPLSWRPYLGRIVLTILGLATGILCLTLGFWKTMAILLFSSLGYGLGCLKDGRIPQIRWPDFLRRR